MSPEQLLGLTVDHRTDLFSLAVVLFEMATGRRPFGSFDPLDVLLASVRRVPRADRVDPRVPPALAEIIDEGLSADPALRYQTATEMGTALQRVRHELGGSESGAAVTADRRPRRRRAVLASLLLGVPTAMWCFGWLMTAAFNGTLGRDGAFASEPALDCIVWSARSLVAPFVYALLTAWVLSVRRFLRQLTALSPFTARAARRVASAGKRLSLLLSLDDVLVFESGLVTFGFAALAAVAWLFSDFIGTWGSNISKVPTEHFMRLGPANEGEKVLYRAVLTVLLLVFSTGLMNAIRLRARRQVGRWGSFVACIAILLVILLLDELPYRILWHNQAPKISYNGMRCYVIGRSSPEVLIFCPDVNPPRNRVVRETDPLIRTTGVTESIFSLPNARH
jgi:hypothetical protein